MSFPVVLFIRNSLGNLFLTIAVVFLTVQGGARQEMGFESTLYEAVQTYCELFVSLKILKPKITTG